MLCFVAVVLFKASPVLVTIVMAVILMNTIIVLGSFRFASAIKFYQRVQSGCFKIEVLFNLK